MSKQDMKSEREIIFVVSESAEGGYEARALGHSIYTEADSAEELRVMVRDAVACHFEDAERPAMIRLHFVREEVLAA
jgi:hypothetical protein